MKITKTEFDGTPEEFNAVAYMFIDGVEKPKSADEKRIEPKEALREMLTRRPIHNGQMSIYNTLANGELAYDEYVSRMGRTSSQIRGVHGALGKRINQTPEISMAGLPGNIDAVVLWRQEDGVGYISLKPEFIEVLKEEGIIK